MRLFIHRFIAVNLPIRSFRWGPITSALASPAAAIPLFAASVPARFSDLNV